MFGAEWTIVAALLPPLAYQTHVSVLITHIHRYIGMEGDVGGFVGVVSSGIVGASPSPAAST
eukprot:37749-Eustigmatos_ZCMA.PRE.1